jgi:hypothetical protein
LLAIAHAAKVAEGDVPNPAVLTELCGATAAAIAPHQLLPALVGITSVQDHASIWVLNAITARLPGGSISPDLLADVATVDALLAAVDRLSRLVDGTAVVIDDGHDTVAAAAERVGDACEAVAPAIASLTAWATVDHPGNKLARAVTRGDGGIRVLALIARCRPGDGRAGASLPSQLSLATRHAASSALQALIVTGSAEKRIQGPTTTSSLYGRSLASILRSLDAPSFPARGGCAEAIHWAITSVVYPDVDETTLAAALPAILGLIERHEPTYVRLTPAPPQ